MILLHTSISSVFLFRYTRVEKCQKIQTELQLLLVIFTKDISKLGNYVEGEINKISDQFLYHQPKVAKSGYRSKETSSKSKTD